MSRLGELFLQLKLLGWKCDGNAQRRFNPLRSNLIWDDEMHLPVQYSQSNPRPKISDEAFELLDDLFIARNIICHLPDCGLSENDIGLSDAKHYEKLWEEALSSDFAWPGFRRVQLAEDDKKELINGLKRGLKKQI